MTGAAAKPPAARPERSARPAEPGQRRLSPAERSRHIVEQAVEFFAEVGFEGGTRELAARLGVTQPLLYRYFPSKDALIDEVYRTVFLRRWDERWETMLADRTRPLRDRLIDVYESYTDAIFSREWMRVYLFAGLKGFEINTWYMQHLEDRLIKPLIAEVRHAAGLPPTEASARELELAWTMHGGIFYYGVRAYVYGLKPHAPKRTVIIDQLDGFLAAAAEVVGGKG